MTAIYLPKPYPDELFYSVVARYISRIGDRARHHVLISLFGSRTSASFDLPSRLNRLEHSALGHFSADLVLKELTLFPYYTSFMSESRKRKCAESFKIDKKAGRPPKRTIGKSRRVARLWSLRVCPSCRSHDLEHLGETYWRRVHQIPGVLVCPTHGADLVETSVSIRRPMDYVDANLATEKRGFRPPPLEPQSRVLAVMVAARCEEFLNGKTNQFAFGRSAARYRQAVRERGFAKGTSGYDAVRLEFAFKSFYGERLLAQISPLLIFGKSLHWLRNALGGVRENFSPLQHALIQIFLENCDVNKSFSETFDRGPWLCPNPYFLHKEPTIKRVSIKRQNGIYTAYAACPCGFRFSFRELEYGSLNIPKVFKRNSYSPEWKAEIIRLKALGRSLTQIRHEMQLPERALIRLLAVDLIKSDASTHVDHQSQEDRQALSPSELNIRRLVRSGAPSNTPPRKREKGLHFEDAAESFSKKAERRVGFWTAKDLQCLQALGDAEERLRSDPDKRRRSRAALMAEAQMYPQQLGNLPLCAQFLETAVENREDYFRRRLRAAANRMVESGRALTQAKVRREAAMDGWASDARFELILSDVVNEFMRGDCHAYMEDPRLSATAVS